MPTISLTPYKARKLAAALPASGIPLPGGVAAAIARHQAAMALPVPRPAEPGSLVKAAVWQAARQILDAADPGSPPAVSTRLVAEARLAEAETRDAYEVTRAVIAESETRLLAAVRQHAPEITAAIQHAHADAVAQLATAARDLPANIDDQVALERGDPVRAAWLAARDLAARLGSLRELLGDVADQPLDARGDLEYALLYCRSKWLYERRSKVPRPSGSLPFWLALVTGVPDSGDLWLPTVGQVSERAAEIRSEDRQAKIAALPPGAVVY